MPEEGGLESSASPTSPAGVIDESVERRAPERPQPIPAPKEKAAAHPPTARSMKALVVDLHRFARYPTLTIGYLVGSLREGGIEVDVLSPLAHGVPAVEREHPEGRWDQFRRRVYLSTHRRALKWRDRIHGLRNWWVARPDARVLREVFAGLHRGPDVILLSVYLEHYASCVEIAKAARARGVPVLVGGAMFRIPEVARAWADIPGVVAVIGAEVDHSLPQLVHDVVAGEDLLDYPGVQLPDGRRSHVISKLNDLDSLPLPDFRDYPWQPGERVIPVMATRGCQWARCEFCSDVVTANGAAMRSRTTASLLDELKQQAERYASRNFIFLDIKLNSDVGLWRGLIEKIRDVVPNAHWVGTVHVDSRKENGLMFEDLLAAHASGMERISFGLESGSQRVLDAMDKDCDTVRNARFIRDAHRAGISVRATMMLGYPGETAEDLECTAAFLEEHEPFLDRVRINRFKAIPGTPIHTKLLEDPEAMPGMRNIRWDERNARASFVYEPGCDPVYRQVKRRVLDLVHAINKKPIPGTAAAFDGLM